VGSSAPGVEAAAAAAVAAGFRKPSPSLSSLQAAGMGSHLALNPVSGAPPWLPRHFALSANQRRDFPMKKSWPSKMRNKSACFGWCGRAISIWFDRPKHKLCKLASGQNPSALH